MTNETRMLSALAEILGKARCSEGNDLLLMGFTVACEFIKPDGSRTFGCMSSDAHGEWIPGWQKEGYLHWALTVPDSNQPDLEDEDEEDGE